MSCTGTGCPAWCTSAVSTATWSHREYVAEVDLMDPTAYLDVYFLGALETAVVVAEEHPVRVGLCLLR